MFILAEPHFAMTIPILFGYRSNFKEKKLPYIIGPLLIVAIASGLFIFQQALFYIVFLVANIYHVNRQSVGISAIQDSGARDIKPFYEFTLHIVTITCLYISLVMKQHDIFLGIAVLTIASLIMSIYIKFRKGSWPSLKQIFLFSQGYLIFVPIAMFSDIILAFAIGISIHYLQYISIGFSICIKGLKQKIWPIIFILIIYSSITTAIQSGLITKDKTSLLILFPAILQLLHFYFDALIWRRSDPIIRETMSKSF